MNQQRYVSSVGFAGGFALKSSFFLGLVQARSFFAGTHFGSGLALSLSFSLGHLTDFAYVFLFRFTAARR